MYRTKYIFGISILLLITSTSFAFAEDIKFIDETITIWLDTKNVGCIGLGTS